MFFFYYLLITIKQHGFIVLLSDYELVTALDESLQLDLSSGTNLWLTIVGYISEFLSILHFQGSGTGKLSQTAAKAKDKRYIFTKATATKTIMMMTMVMVVDGDNNRVLVVEQDQSCIRTTVPFDHSLNYAFVNIISFFAFLYLCRFLFMYSPSLCCLVLMQALCCTYKIKIFGIVL